MRRLFTPGWLARHGVVAALVLGFLGMGWWQIHRAAAGNALSWAYAVEWPIFAAFVVFVWWREVRQELGADHDAPAAHNPTIAARTDSESDHRTNQAAARNGELGEQHSPPGSRLLGIRRPVLSPRASNRDSAGTAHAAAGDSELAAYNEYLAWLNRNPGARPADYPG